MRTPEDTPFQLKSSHQSFADKQKNVFEQLNIAEKNAKNLLKSNDQMEIDNKPFIGAARRSETKYLRGKESIFKRPEAPISKCLPVGKIPDFRKNPHKWTKYSLKDVKEEDMSDRGNTAAAMSFLKELESRKEQDNSKLESLPSKIEFNKSVLIKDTDSTNECCSSFKNSKVVMPEYVVGQKIKKDKKSKEKRNANATKQLKLDHLFDEENEDDA